MNPGRDVAYAMPNYLERAILLFRHENSWYMEWFFKSGGTHDDLNELIEAWNRYGEAVTELVGQDFKTIAEAYNHSGYFKLKRETQMLGFMVLGMVIQSAYFVGYRDAVTVGGTGTAFRKFNPGPAVASSSSSRLRCWLRSKVYKLFLKL